MRSADGVSLATKPKRSKFRRAISISALNWSCSSGRYSWSKPRSSAGFTFCIAFLERRDPDFPAGAPRAGGVSFLHVVLDDRLELLGDALAFERHRLRAVDVHRRDRIFVRTGQADADVGVLGFTRTIDHAAHHCDAHLFDSRVALAPRGHLLAQVGLDPVRQLLERG